MKLGRKTCAGLLAVALIFGAGLAAASTKAAADTGTLDTGTQTALLVENAAAPVFSDVSEDAWYADAVHWCREHGIMNGTTTTTFSPDTTVTRAMLATVLYRVAGSPAVSSNASFSDVAADSWCADAVAWAAANGIIGGYGNGLFGTNDPVTHQQIVTILWRYDGSSPANTSLSFSDADAIQNYAVQAVSWAAANGIISDWAHDSFQPTAGTTRAQVASVFYRYLAGEEGSSNEGIDTSKLEHATTDVSAPVVYMTTDISPEGLAAVYEALNWTPTGNVAVKLSTGEPPASNYLRVELIGDLVRSFDSPTIVECNTAYGGSRAATAAHMQVAADHGYTSIADVDILDAEGSSSIPVTGGSHLTENFVGSHFQNYDSYIVLSHFKGHAMAGFGGAIKNISIGLGSSEGKCWIHSGGTSRTSPWGGDQDAFLESMGEAGSAVVNALDGQIVYVNVMNRLSVDCDCDGNPAEPDMHDIGILASTDPVALDQACVDLVYAAEDGASLIRRMESRNGIHTLEHAEDIGLGSRSYRLIGVGG